MKCHVCGKEIENGDDVILYGSSTAWVNNEGKLVLGKDTPMELIQEMIIVHSGECAANAFLDTYPDIMEIICMLNCGA
jgi:hypothetical protein